MKRIFVVALSSLALSISTASGQENSSNQSSPCTDKFGNSPPTFEGQKCWLLHALKDSIYIYGDKLATNGIKYQPIKILPKEVEDFLNPNAGLNNVYLPKNNTAWGGNWYSCKEGGIARRFHSKLKNYPTADSLDWGKVKKLSKEEIFKLSPAEKLDIYLNDSNFSVTKFELKNRGPERTNRQDDGWCGFCNGARIAGIIMPEPRKTITLWSRGDDNFQEVTFSIGDIKALISAAYMHPAFTFSFGNASESTGDNNPNPGIFDMFLRLYLGKYKIPFVVDDSYGPAIFNETVLGYKRTVTRTRALTTTERAKYKGASMAVDINLILYLQDELSYESSESETISTMADSNLALNRHEEASVHKAWVHRKNYKYTLCVDENNVIVDGYWRGEPLDFAWAAHGNGNEDLNVIINDVPGIPKTQRNKSIDWFQVKFLLTKSLEP